MKLILFSAIITLSLSSVRAQNPDSLILYKSIDTVDLYLHTFFPEEYTTQDYRGAVVFFFGGGWTGGSIDQFYPHCDTLSKLGMVCMAADYRVSSRHQTTPAECVKDGNSAVRWIREHAGELGIDPDKIAAGGGSAGGHVAAATSNIHGFDEPDEDSAISSDPNLLVLFNPVYDNGPDGYGYSRVEEYWESFSPMHNIDSATAPTIVFLGTEDNLIPVATAVTYDSLLKEAGVYSELYLYEGQGHGFFNSDAYFDSTMSKAIPFLESFGFMEQDPIGITGCMDPAYEEFDPLATIPDSAACITLGIGEGALAAGMVDLSRAGLYISSPGHHRITIHDCNGRMIEIINGMGPQVYRFTGLRRTGYYIIEVTTIHGTYREKMLID